jgi:hypothetical protein
MYAQLKDGQLINKRKRNQITIRNLNVPIDRLTDAELAQHTGYYKIIPDTTLPEGARIDAAEYTLEGLQIIETVTAYTDAATLAAEAQAQAHAARLAEIERLLTDSTTQAVARVIALGNVLARFTDPETGEPYQFPLDPDAVYARITDALAQGELPPAEENNVALLEVTYRRARAVMTDADIAAVASYLQGAQ